MSLHVRIGKGRTTVLVAVLRVAASLGTSSLRAQQPVQQPLLKKMIDTWQSTANSMSGGSE